MRASYRFQRVLLIGVILACPLFLGCGGSESVLGSWSDTTDDEEFLTFNSDNTWDWIDNDGTEHYSGTWSQNGDSVAVQGTDENGTDFAITGELRDGGAELFLSQFVELKNDGSLHSEKFSRLRN